ncbi:MAG: LapA family protein [Clostridiaceae bacterium]
MQIWFVFSLVFALIIAAFAALNSDVVTIRLIFAKYELSQSIVIIISAVIGAVVAILLSLFGKIKSAMRTRELNAAIRVSEAKISELDLKLKKCESALAAAKAQTAPIVSTLKDTAAELDAEKK